MQCNASAIMQWFICAVLQSQSNAIGANVANVATPVSKWCREQMHRVRKTRQCSEVKAQCEVCVKLG